MITVRVAGPLLKADGDPTVLERLQPWINAMVPLAMAIKARVKDRGDVVGEPPHYSPHKGFMANPAYAQAAGAGDGSKKRLWPSSLAFHNAAGARAGTGNVTGGMWRGFQVRTYDKNAVVLDFAGSSIGRDSQTGKRGGPIKLLNSAKAGALWLQWNVNVTQPSDDEQDALHGVVIQQARIAVGRAFGYEVPANDIPAVAQQLYDQIAAAWLTK